MSSSLSSRTHSTGDNNRHQTLEAATITILTTRPRHRIIRTLVCSLIKMMMNILMTLKPQTLSLKRVSPKLTRTHWTCLCNRLPKRNLNRKSLRCPSGRRKQLRKRQLLQLLRRLKKQRTLILSLQCSKNLLHNCRG